MTRLLNLRGVVDGQTIRLTDDVDLPDGQAVIVDLAFSPSPEPRMIPAELAETFGAFADNPDEVDEFDRWYRAARKVDRKLPDIEE